MASMAALPSKPVGLEAPPPEVDPLTRRMAGDLGLTLTVAEWLRRQGHDGTDATRRFLEPRLAHLSSPEGMVDRDAAARRVADAIRGRETVCVFGDYDCDGMT